MIKADKSTLREIKASLEGTVFDFQDRRDIHLSLLGSYQIENAANCLCAIDILRQSGMEIPESAILNGLKEAKWPARFEIINRAPLVIADGGHNQEGVDAAVKSAEKYFDQKLGIITGVMADKDYPYMAGRISSIAEMVFCVTPDNPRALKSDELAKVFSELGVSAMAFDSVDEAVEHALTWARENGKAIMSLGSLYMYGEVAVAVKKHTNK